MKYCLVTVTSQSFIPGTLVMIHSFLKYNPWFARAGGDIVIIHDFIPPRLQRLFNCFKNVAWLQVSDTLKEKVDALCKGVPHLDLESRKKRFYSLELFRLRDYGKVLFCDSDVLFLDNISELFNLPGTRGIDEKDRLLAGGDNHYFSGKATDAETFLPVETGASPGKNADAKGVIKNTFAAGFFIADKHYLTPHHYHNLLALLDTGLWCKIKDMRTVHVILNLYFKDRWRILSARYNFPLLHSGLIARKENITMEDIKVLHFHGKAKPWECLTVIQSVSADAPRARLVNLWYLEYQDFLSQYYLRLRFVNREVKDK